MLAFFRHHVGNLCKNVCYYDTTFLERYGHIHNTDIFLKQETG